jgi:subtilase family serine protease
MNLPRAWSLLFLAAVCGLFVPTMYAQGGAYPVVPADSVEPGTARPHIWAMAADPATTAVHGPGHTDCGPVAAVDCYYFPSDLRTAYATGFVQNSNGGMGMVIGIVDAFHYAGADSDLQTFSTQFGLPQCTIASGCLTQVSQTGGAPTAGFNQGWALETNLDLQWAHAIAPNAKILLVEGTTNSFVNLGTAVLYARAHADVVSNSYGGNEFAGEAGFDGNYSGSPVPLLFSSGDTGAVAEYPCTSPFTVCVGGTSLFETTTTYRSVEKAWSGSGGGCSLYEAAPVFETGFSTCGATRGVPDVAGIADPYTGAIVYLGAGIGAPYSAGYYIFGGTSLACPVTAGLVANIDAARVFAGKSKLSGNLGQLVYQGAANPYYHYRYYDVTLGSSGFPATPGWDKATGLGVPLGPALANYLVNLP